MGFLSVTNDILIQNLCKGFPLFSFSGLYVELITVSSRVSIRKESLVVASKTNEYLLLSDITRKSVTFLNKVSIIRESILASVISGELDIMGNKICFKDGANFITPPR